jgi:hypothetical protein
MATETSTTCVTMTGRQTMAKETSTTGDKQSAEVARDVEWLERITRRDSDSKGGSSVCTNDIMTDTLDDVDMMKSSPATVSAPRSITDAKLSRNGNNSSNHHLDSEEEKQEVTEITKSDNRDASMGRDRRARRPRHLDYEEEDPTPGAFAFSNEQGNSVRRLKGHITASMVEEDETSLIPLMELENDGPTSPSVLSEPRGPSTVEESSILGELAEPSQEDQELRRRYQDLQQKIKEAVTGTVIVENDDDDDEDSSICGLSRNCFFLVATVLLLIIVGFILGVTIPLLTSNNKNSPSIDSVVTPTQSPAPTKAPIKAPTQSPTQSPSQSPAPTKAPTAAPTASPTQSQSPTQSPTQSPAPTTCTRLDCLAEILLQNEVSDAAALQDDSSPQFRALRWLANEDTAVLDLDSTPAVILVERYVLAMLYFATRGEGWFDHYSATSVCEWNMWEVGVFCNQEDLVVAILVCKSTHEEVPVLISKFRFDSPVSLPFYLNRS